MTLQETRKSFHLSQAEASAFLNVPIRTYIRYETDNSYGNDLKRSKMIETLVDGYEITESKGLLTIDQIKEGITDLFNNRYKDQIEYCYLFGSYAKGYATEKSDIDLCVATSLTGFKFIGISEAVRNVLHKKVDVIRFSSLEGNLSLVNEIMKDGIKIYG